MEVVPAGEERLAPDHLGEDAAAGPHVDGGGVGLVLDEQLGRAVPARDDVLGERLVLGLGVWEDGASKAEVADLQVAVLVHEEVARLEVAMQHVRRVDGVDTTQDLVEEVLEVLVGERLLRVDDVVQVGVHQLRDEVHVLPAVLATRRWQDVHQAKHVVVLEVAQDLNLAEEPFAVDGVLEGLGYLLDRHWLGSLDVAAGRDQPVCPLPHHLAHRILRRHFEVHAADIIALCAVRSHLELLLLHVLVRSRLLPRGRTGRGHEGPAARTDH
mmetsp:Transcript_42244/g.90136  ORF Transcript_42244/g.90136 Transcript_42244/m.90136 type:complete len:270 (+) Transcript_42244:701-1510(+)